MATDTIESNLPPKERLTRWLARLYRHRLTTTTGGNLSFIDDDGILYITPSGGDKAEVPASDIVSCRPESDCFEGPKAPSMELHLHKAAYAVRPDCRAVLHAHSMALIAFSLGVKESVMDHCFQNTHSGVPDTRCLFSAWMTCGKVGFCPYFPPGSDKLANACAKMLRQADCVVLQNHGVVTLGQTLQQAYDRFVTLENLAQSIINALPIGIPHPLKESILDIKDQKNIEYQKYLRPVHPCTSAPSTCASRIITGREKEIRAELCRFVKRAYEHNIFTSSSGSISMRCSSFIDAREVSGEVSFLITPSNVDRRCINPNCVCFISNIKCKGSGTKCKHEKTRSEIMDQYEITKHMYYHPNECNVIPSHASDIHETIYSMHPEVNSIILAQPPYATAFCIAGTELNSAGIPESHLVLGSVKTLPFESLEEGALFVSKSLDISKGVSTILIDGFGIISVGTSILKTYVQIEVCESICGVMLTAMRRGPPVLLNDNQIKEIDVIFNQGH